MKKFINTAILASFFGLSAASSYALFAPVKTGTYWYGETVISAHSGTYRICYYKHPMVDDKTGEPAGAGRYWLSRIITPNQWTQCPWTNTVP